MTDRSVMWLGAMIGAAVGVGVGFLLFTERGRRLRAELQPEIDTIVSEAMRLGQVVDDLRNSGPVKRAPAAAGAVPLAWPRRTH